MDGSGLTTVRLQWSSMVAEPRPPLLLVILVQMNDLKSPNLCSDQPHLSYNLKPPPCGS